MRIFDLILDFREERRTLKLLEYDHFLHSYNHYLLRNIHFTRRNLMRRPITLRRSTKRVKESLLYTVKTARSSLLSLLYFDQEWALWRIQSHGAKKYLAGWQMTQGGEGGARKTKR